eukprot:TRINITY_DN12492_c0_g1_i1.p1 TRINITY_DN12492_c0_g1~~TRINITY_DN12492_c0_g1_i1.p1  ORF type:complete len:108 (+),score=22.35 TRINITY_DN12492_c0_g1_i1:78-401(+)
MSFNFEGEEKTDRLGNNWTAVAASDQITWNIEIEGSNITITTADPKAALSSIKGTLESSDANTEKYKCKTMAGADFLLNTSSPSQLTIKGSGVPVIYQARGTLEKVD